ncbi:MAG: hypothetical protein QOG94_3842 [Solirubrobacteraceae bacterium]|jgi:hypothetical protein|nr:hypothetical protein [Solirubrobacteraceae bacterium]MEA2139081.1 hypothetical protein [Solirubrobacteraceae bacterium]
MRQRNGATFGLLVCVLALGGASAQAASAYTIQVSTTADRSGAALLNGQSYTQSDQIYVFLGPVTPVTKDIVRVKFYLDDPTTSRAPSKIEKTAPYDFVNTARDGSPVAFSLAPLSAGDHTVTAQVEKVDGSKETASGAFVIAAPPPPLLFSDEFNGTSLDTDAWAPYVSRGHSGNGLRRGSAFSLADGNLVVTAKMVDGQIVSGGMRHRVDYKYGRYVFRVRTDVDPTGTMSGVVLTWPKLQRLPQFTENDIYETGAGLNTRTPFRSFVHYGITNQQKYFVHTADASEWHIMEMDWRQKSLKIYRDGNLVWTVTNEAVIPDVLHHVSIQLDARHERKLTRTVRMYVDYIRIYG